MGRYVSDAELAAASDTRTPAVAKSGAGWPAERGIHCRAISGLQLVALNRLEDEAGRGGRLGDHWGVRRLYLCGYRVRAGGHEPLRGRRNRVIVRGDEVPRRRDFVPGGLAEHRRECRLREQSLFGPNPIGEPLRDVARARGLEPLLLQLQVGSLPAVTDRVGAGDQRLGPDLAPQPRSRLQSSPSATAASVRHSAWISSSRRTWRPTVQHQVGEHQAALPAQQRIRAAARVALDDQRSRRSAVHPGRSNVRSLTLGDHAARPPCG
jgi:hypothetical protein